MAPSINLKCKDCSNPRDNINKNAYCVTCRNRRQREANTRYIEKLKLEGKYQTTFLANVRENQLKAKLATFGLTLEDYRNLLKSQNYSCAICATIDASGKGRWHIDHDHKTGFVRGLLCHKCNAGLGQFNDSVLNLNRAIYYLEQAKLNQINLI